MNLAFSEVKFVILLLVPSQVQCSGFEANKTHDLNARAYFSVADPVKLDKSNVQFRATENSHKELWH